MDTITSFTVDHIKLNTGIYVSRKDKIGGQTLTTFDLRFTKPNTEPAMDTAALHAIEHLGATFLRNDKQWKEKTVYFGPMGCRTGFYVIFSGDLCSEDILDVIKRMCDYIMAFEGKIPGASAVECGNYIDLNLPMAKYYTNKFIKEVLENPTPDRLNYPQ